jgi:hypothetical protein
VILPLASTATLTRLGLKSAVNICAGTNTVSVNVRPMQQRHAARISAAGPHHLSRLVHAHGDAGRPEAGNVGVGVLQGAADDVLVRGGGLLGAAEVQAHVEVCGPNCDVLCACSHNRQK